MRKVLLATTALVAMSVTAASADITISGSYRYQYAIENEAANVSSSDGNVTIKASTTADNGITYTVVQNNGIHTGDVEDAYLQMSGDFGTIFLGETDSALDRVDGITADNQAYKRFGNGTTDAPSIASQAILVGDEGNATVNFISPSMNGFQVVGSSDDTAGESGFGIGYSNDLASVIYQAKGGGGTEETMVAAGISVAGFGVNVSSKESTTGSTKTTSDGIAVSYSINGINLVAESARGTVGARKDKYTNIGATYSVAPGVTAAVEAFDDDTNNLKTSGTFLSLNVSF
jgi:hypothetical protein